MCIRDRDGEEDGVSITYKEDGAEVIRYTWKDGERVVDQNQTTRRLLPINRSLDGSQFTEVSKDDSNDQTVGYTQAGSLAYKGELKDGKPVAGSLKDALPGGFRHPRRRLERRLEGKAQIDPLYHMKNPSPLEKTGLPFFSSLLI